MKIAQPYMRKGVNYGVGNRGKVLSVDSDNRMVLVCWDFSTPSWILTYEVRVVSPLELLAEQI